MEWLIWGVLLILQNAAHTATSRARNSKGSKGLWYNGIASVFSNGIWFASQGFIFAQFLAAQGDVARLSLTGIFYITLTAAGSVGAQWYLTGMETKRGIER